MAISLLAVIVYLVFWLIVTVVAVYLLVLIIKALKKYINSKDVREEKAVVRKSLAEALRENRVRCKMTQAVSKWENGTSDPSTSNLIALAKLYGISAEDLLKSVNNMTDRRKT